MAKWFREEERSPLEQSGLKLNYAAIDVEVANHRASRTAAIRRRDENSPDSQSIFREIRAHFFGIPWRVPYQDDFDFGDPFKLLYLSMHHGKEHFAVRAGGSCQCHLDADNTIIRYRDVVYQPKVNNPNSNFRVMYRLQRLNDLFFGWDGHTRLRSGRVIGGFGRHSRRLISVAIFVRLETFNESHPCQQGALDPYRELPHAL